MFTLPLLSLIVAALPALGQTINLQDGIHNSTSIEGTWTTGSGAVLTGINAANPVNMTFNYPKNTGRSFSFTDAGNWEQFDYRMASNATDPHCITAVLTWQHGSFEFLPNGSLQLTPFEGDGFQQVQSRCAAFSSPINRYNQPILFKEWRIFPLPQGGVHLNLYEFDGTPVAPMSLAANPPNMLPTTTLVATATATASSRGAKRDLASSATKSMSLMLGGVGAMAGLGAVLVLL